MSRQRHAEQVGGVLYHLVQHVRCRGNRLHAPQPLPGVERLPLRAPRAGRSGVDVIGHGAHERLTADRCTGAEDDDREGLSNTQHDAAREGAGRGITVVQLTREAPAGRQLIQSYNPREFRVNDVSFKGAVPVNAHETRLWPVSSFDALTIDDFAPLKSMTVDVCLLGCGAKLARLPKSLRDALKEQGLHVEPMDTPSACRTFNMLIAENRMAVAALIPV